MTTPGGSSAPQPDTLLGAEWVDGSLAQAALQRYRVTVDPATLTAQATLAEGRTATATDDLWLLSIENFMTPATLTIDGVRETAESVEVLYTIAHPFAAPTDLNAPTAKNRADLGVAGRLLLLLDVPSAAGNTYFQTDEPAIANTAVLNNADGYFTPEGLLNPTGTIADTFPYKLLVDESQDNRLGASNGLFGSGNYDADGWQRDNMGATHDQWTGYGVLHQGQRASNILALDRDALAAGPLSFDTVIVVKYNDPRGGGNAVQKRSNRLPVDPADVTRFTYRMPHGALDVERLEYLGESGGLMANQLSGSTLDFRVRDWDARATETTLPDLAGDPVVGNVAIGETGIPAMQLSLPDVLGLGTIVTFDPGTDLIDNDAAYPGGDAAPDSGAAFDELFFQNTISNTTLSGQVDGLKTGLVRALDAEESLVSNDWQRALDPNLFITNDAPRSITYQRVIVDLAGISNLPPSAAFDLCTGVVPSGGPVALTASGFGDPEGDAIVVEVDWDNNGSYDPAGTYSSPYPTEVLLTSPIGYTFTTAPDNRTLPIRYHDAGPPQTATLFFAVLATCSVAPPAKFGTDIATMWAPDNDQLAVPGSIPADFAAFRNTTYRGFVLQRRYFSPSFDYNLYRVDDQAPHAEVPITSGDLAGLLTNKTVNDVEVDSTNRVFLTRDGSGWSNMPPLIKYFVSPPGAVPNIYWFDYTGSPVATANTITTVNPVVAIALAHNDDLYAIDRLHVLRRYPKATNYTEDLTAPFPMNLAPIIGSATGPDSSATNVKVADLVQSWYNGAFYILMNNGSSTANGRIYRIACGGGLAASSVPFTIADFGSGIRNVDIAIDQLNECHVMTPEGDVQLVVGGYGGNSAGLADLWIFNTDLVMTASMDFGTGDTNASRGRLALSWDNILLTSKSYGNDYTYYTPPSGWR